MTEMSGSFPPINPIRLEVFNHLFASIAEEMGAVLRRSSYSPNIKERRDFSCAVFDASGAMIAQAAHIPVHLGSMPLSVQSAISSFSTLQKGISADQDSSSPLLAPGDMILLNDPYRGGTHLPDMTLVSPVFFQGDLAGFVASRAHHADVGGASPGSMTIAREIYQEGLIIPPVRLFEAGRLNQGIWDLILANVRTPEERSGDLWAQVAANQRGAARLGEMLQRYGAEEVSLYMQALLTYTERLTRHVLQGLPDGTYTFEDALDNDGVSEQPVNIREAVEIMGDQALVDFTGSSLQVNGSLNAVFAITLSAVYYVFRCLMDLDVPTNSGSLAPIRLIAPPGTVVNALPPAPVAGGNVETSQRIVDVLLGALAKAAPLRIPAASQGTMNNLTIGGWDPERHRQFAYYETIAGGLGARPNMPGPSAMHSHMTNTLNTPVEALEYTYPLRVLRYEIRRGSGGPGRQSGGDGIRRDVQLLAEARVSLITERRILSPYSLEGGESGARGENILLRGDQELSLPGKGSFTLQRGDILSIRTPGGGGFGEPS